MGVGKLTLFATGRIRGNDTTRAPLYVTGRVSVPSWFHSTHHLRITLLRNTHVFRYQKMIPVSLPPGLCVNRSGCKPAILIHRSKFLSPLRGEKLLFNPILLGVFRSCVSPIAPRATGEVQTLHAASNGREPSLFFRSGNHVDPVQ